LQIDGKQEWPSAIKNQQSKIAMKRLTDYAACAG
jgi:hypothetical protein